MTVGTAGAGGVAALAVNAVTGTIVIIITTAISIVKNLFFIVLPPNGIDRVCFGRYEVATEEVYSSVFLSFILYSVYSSFLLFGHLQMPMYVSLLSNKPQLSHQLSPDALGS